MKAVAVFLANDDKSAKQHDGHQTENKFLHDETAVVKKDTGH
jgi:hypothetical protein